MHPTPYKIYVDVIARMAADGTITPLSITWEDGRTYEIDEVIDCTRVASVRAGGIGMRYTVRIGRATTYVWLEDETNAWFVERK